MTKKEFKKRASIYSYGKRNKGGIRAIFFDWKDGKKGGGFKYCIYSRMINATQSEMLNMLHDFIEGRIEDVPWYVQFIIAQTDEERFKVPFMSYELSSLIKYK